MINFDLLSFPVVFPFLFATGLLVIVLGTIVYFNPRKSSANYVFSLFCVSLAGWAISTGLMSLGPGSNIMPLCAVLTTIFPLPIPYLILLFSASFPGEKIHFSRLTLLLLAIPWLLILVAAPSGQLISIKDLPGGNGINVTLGYLDILYALYFLVYFTLAGIFFQRKYSIASQTNKIRFKYFFVGLFLTLFIGATFNLFLSFLKINNLIYFGPLSIIFVASTTAYAILKYHIMDVAIAIKKTTVYSLVTTGITFTYVVVVMGFAYLWRSIMGYDSFWPVVPAALVISITFVPVRSYFHEVADRLFFRRVLEYQKILKEITRLIVSVTDLHVLFRIIDRTIVRVMCIKSASILLLEEKEGKFLVEKTNGLPDEVKGLQLELDNPLVLYFYEKKDAVVIDELRSQLEGDIFDVAGKEKLIRIIREIEKFDATISIPSFLKGKLVGILNLGEKLSGELYSPDDLELLFTLVTEASVAIENAKLYRDIMETRDYLNNLIKGSDDAIVTLDLDGNILSWNDGAKRIFGYEAAEAIGRPPKSVEENEFRESLKHIIRGEGLKAYETKAKNKIGVEVPLLLTASPVSDSDGKITGAFVIMKDITELKKADKMKNEFVTTVSHELRTPLATIKEGINLILEGIPGQINQEQINLLSTIKSNVDRLARLIVGLLDISTIESGKLELKKEPLNIVDVVSRVVSELQFMAKEKQLELRALLPPHGIELLGDKDKIIQIFINLISNALKFTNTGSVEVAVIDHGPEIECVVADTGIGISKEDARLLFSKFQQFNRTPGSGEKGTGLGLSIVKGWVEAHQGKVWAESELGQGTKVFFTLPKGG